MSERKIDNGLYSDLVSTFNRALPLEYAIRAAYQENPDELLQLSKIEQRIRHYWIDLGASDALIESDSLVDSAWDVIQIGFPLLRRHGRVNSPEIVDLIYQGLTNVREVFGDDVDQLRIPASRYFRICDLLNGNDVSSMLNAVALGLKESKNYEAEDSIKLSKFVRGIREPIHLHPGLDYVVTERREEERPIERFGIVLDTEMEFSLPDLKRQIREFLYQFAIRRGALRSDHTSHELIDEFLWDEWLGKIDKHRVTRLDGFISSLSGLYCWDLVQRYRQEGKKSAVIDAIQSTLAIYPTNVRQVGEDTIKKNYYKTKEMIEKVSFSAVTTKR